MSDVLRVRCLLQQCTSARLQVVLPDTENNIQPEFVQIGRGVVFFVCFMKEATDADVEKLAKSALNVKLSQGDDMKSTSVLDLPGDILIIPQACLGGKMKGKMFQYHYNIGKELGLEHYRKFVDLCKKFAAENSVWSQANCKVLSGTYGIRQVYSTETNGPNIHLIEF